MTRRPAPRPEGVRPQKTPSLPRRKERRRRRVRAGAVECQSAFEKTQPVLLCRVDGIGACTILTLAQETENLPAFSLTRAWAYPYISVTLLVTLPSGQLGRASCRAVTQTA